MDIWGEIKVKKIEDGVDFWCLMTELLHDVSDFLYDKNTIIEAYKNGNLYGLNVNETDEMYQKGSRIDNIFCVDSMYLLPCFCIKEDNKAIIIWTHTRARNNGFAKKLVEILGIKYVDNPLPDSLEFWKKCNVEVC